MLNDQHVGFIIAAFVVTFGVVGLMVGMQILQHRRLKTQLALMALQLSQQDPDAGPMDGNG